MKIADYACRTKVLTSLMKVCKSSLSCFRFGRFSLSVSDSLRVDLLDRLGHDVRDGRGCQEKLERRQFVADLLARLQRLAGFRQVCLDVVDSPHGGPLVIDEFAGAAVLVALDLPFFFSLVFFRRISSRSP